MRLFDVVNTYIKKFLKNEELYSLEGTFTNVRENVALADFMPLEGAKVFNVRLNITRDSLDGFILIPAEGSKGIITWMSKVTAYASMVGTIDKYILKAGETDIVYAGEEITFNGGDNGGLINIATLVTKVNTLESDLNALKAAITAWIPVPTDGGTALKVITTAWAASQITPTVQAEIEDTNVSH